MRRIIRSRIVSAVLTLSLCLQGVPIVAWGEESPVSPSDVEAASQVEETSIASEDTGQDGTLPDGMGSLTIDTEADGQSNEGLSDDSAEDPLVDEPQSVGEADAVPSGDDTVDDETALDTVDESSDYTGDDSGVAQGADPSADTASDPETGDAAISEVEDSETTDESALEADAAIEDADANDPAIEDADADANDAAIEDASGVEAAETSTSADTKKLKAQASDAVTYDLNTMAPFAGRTRASVAARYTAALNIDSSYEGSDSATWYTKKPSDKSPYAAGKLTGDTLAVMHDMTDFYRWLAGVSPLKKACVHSDDLQAGALVRGFDFEHAVDNSKRPADMPVSLWNQGANASHNVLAWGYTPQGSITAWMNEGYDTSTKTWDTLGHRYALIAGSLSNVQFGYAAGVAIGLDAEYNNDDTGLFSAFPAPGPMPNDIVYPSVAAWSLDLDETRVQFTDETHVKVQIVNQRTNKSFTRSAANDTLQAFDDLVQFAQPIDTNGALYTDSYRVVVSGLQDVSTGKAAKVVYTVKFADMTSNVGTYVTSVGADFSDLTIYKTLKSKANLQKVAAVLPMKVLVRCSTGYECTVPVAGPWKLDTKNKRYTNSASASNLPSNVRDKKGLLKKISISYSISDDKYDFYNFLTLSPNPVKAGGTCTVFVRRTNMSTDTSRVYKVIDKGNGLYQGKLWLNSATAAKTSKKKLEFESGDVYHQYKVKGIKASQAGEYVSIYFNKDWGDTAYVSTSIEKLSVKGVAKKAQPMKVKAKKAKLTVKKSAVKKKAKTLKSNVKFVKKAKGKVTYKNVSKQKVAKKFKVNKKNGKLTIPKKTKKGTYTVKIKVKAKGTTKYKAGSKTVTFKVVVK